MKTILVLGAGRSSSWLIRYLLEETQKRSWKLVVGDQDVQSAQQHIGPAEHAQAIAFDITNASASANAIESADVVVSLLPAHLHPLVAALCLEKKKHVLTASYVSPEMKAFDTKAKELGLLFLNECGLDPGIDHMSAMKIIDVIWNNGGTLTSFESFTGGLIAPETDPENPWRYKFTWNPRNVVMAGQSTAKYLQEGQYKYIPYQQLFTRTTKVNVPGYGDFEGYANRDSLSYIDMYQLYDVKTMLRGTLRYGGYCNAWNVLVQLGCCDDSYVMENVESMTHRDFINSFLAYDNTKRVEEKLTQLFLLKTDGEEMKRLQWSGFFNEERIGLAKGTPAQITEHILNKKWKLKPDDQDMIVMWHRFVYEKSGSKKEIQSSLVVKGTNSVYTAMAKTVGLPLGIAAVLLLEERIMIRGVAVPVMKEIYNPVLKELEKFGVVFEERVIG